MASFARGKKAQKVVVLDLHKVSTFCDFFVIATATSIRQVNSLADSIQDDLSRDSIKTIGRVDSMDQSGWLVLDFATVVVHIFYKPVREFYGLERLWSDAKRLRIPRKAAI
ncbi:ribosome silencing factor [Candidatus Omnitrophota bacterium]